MEGNIVAAATVLGKMIGAGLAMVGVIGGGIGIGVVAAAPSRRWPAIRTPRA